jgi:hypothetical protein
VSGGQEILQLFEISNAQFICGADCGNVTGPCWEASCDIWSFGLCWGIPCDFLEPCRSPVREGSHLF